VRRAAFASMRLQSMRERGADARVGRKPTDAIVAVA
jgi:hypothetical protein